MPLVTPEGNLLLTGGMSGNSNYTPTDAVWLLRFGGEPKVTTSGFTWWIWILLTLVVLATIVLFIYRRRTRGNKLCDSHQRQNVQTSPAMLDIELMNRIRILMEEQKPYLNSELKLGDIATALGTNRNAISSVINTQCNCSFTQLVNTYRINHAKGLMRSQPDIKISEVWTASGFTTESNFFRTFKAITGMTPSDWKQKKD